MKSGYVKTYWPGHPMASDGGYVLHHRLIAWRHLGRSLRTDEIVHHINGNKQDNRAINLAVASSRSHRWIHSGKCPHCGKTLGTPLLQYAKQDVQQRRETKAKTTVGPSAGPPSLEPRACLQAGGAVESGAPGLPSREAGRGRLLAGFVLPLPTLSLPGSWLLQHALLFAAAAALLVGVTLGAVLVGKAIAYGVNRGLAYWRGE